MIIKGHRPSIFILLFPCGPATIFWRVVPINVNSLQRELFRSRPHVGEKSRERKPFIAYGYSSSSVCSPSFVVGICASLYHAGPRLIGWRVSASLALAMHKIISGAKFLLKTAATCGITGFEIAGQRGRESTTIALANPCRVASNVGSPADYNKTAESLANKVYECGHELSITPNNWLLVTF